MMTQSHLFKRVTIAGVGLMGGSLGMALKKQGLAREVIGLSNRQSSLVDAIKVKAIDTASTDVAQAIKNADLVVLATPVDSIVKLLRTINPYLKRGCVITDVGSAKVEIVEAADKILSNPGFYVGSHPLVGSEKKGVNYARDDLFQNSTCIMTPTKETNQLAKDKIRHMWLKLGAKVKDLTPQEHDETLSYISHLPHLAAFGLIETIPPQFLEYAPSSLKEMTRIAASSPQMWNDICLANSRNVLQSLDEFVKQLSSLRKAIVHRDDKALIKYFEQAQQKREKLN